MTSEKNLRTARKSHRRRLYLGQRLVDDFVGQVEALLAEPLDHGSGGRYPTLLPGMNYQPEGSLVRDTQ